MSTQRKRLGKGLGALLGESAVEAARRPGGETERVAVERIEPNRHQPRVRFDDEGIAELAASIAQMGILQPLLVTPLEDGRYMLVSGERRLRAARRAGLPTVPVVVREADDRELLELALVENLQREDLDPIEEATGYRELVDAFEMTQAEVAERVGRSRPAIANAIRLLDLPDEVQGLVRGGGLSAGHGRALLGLADRRGIAPLARKVVRDGLNVRQVERMVKRENRGSSGKDPGARRPAPDELERRRVEEDLQRALGTRVRLHTDRSGKGRLEIDFFSFDDLERIVQRLKAGA
ncbi:MAG: ParB/RepB/Spo0J family partition protein [Gemmatimonadota bacterium]